MIQTVSQEVAAAILLNLKLSVLQEVCDGLTTMRARVSYVDRILQSAERGAKSAQLIASCELFGAVVNGDFDWCFTPIPEMLAKWSAELMAAAGIADEPPKPVDVVVPEEEANAVVPEVIVAVVPEEEANAVVPGVEVNTVVPRTPEQIEYAERAAKVVAAITLISLSEKDEATEKKFEYLSIKLHVRTRSMMDDISRGKVATDTTSQSLIWLLEKKVGLYNEWLAKHVKDLAAKKNCLPTRGYYEFV